MPLLPSALVSLPLPEPSAPLVPPAPVDPLASPAVPPLPVLADEFEPDPPFSSRELLHAAPASESSRARPLAPSLRQNLTVPRYSGARAAQSLP